MVGARSNSVNGWLVEIRSGGYLHSNARADKAGDFDFFHDDHDQCIE